MSSVAEEFVLVRSGETTPVGEQLLTRRLDLGIPQACFVAVDAQDQKHLLVEIGDEKGVKDHSSQGVTLGSRPLLVGDESVTFADLHCRITSLDLVFERLVEDVIKRLAKSDAGSPGTVCRSTLADWRALLKSAGQPMSRDSIVGIAGELAVLREMAEREPVGALDAWKGPEGWTHDFAAHGDEMEVKSTASVDGNFIHISNVDQLDPTAATSLHLVVVHLREDTAGETLDDRIRQLIDMGVPSDGLIQKVAHSGYVFESEADGGVRLTVRGIRAWRVGQKFPGLRRSELAHRLHGVSDVKYQLALDSAPRPLTEDATQQLLVEWLEPTS